MTDRRAFLSRLAAVPALLAAFPRKALGFDPPPTAPLRWFAGGMPAPPDGHLPDEFWNELRQQFLIPPDEAFFNTGTLGASPRAVLDAVVDHMTHVERDLAHWDYKGEHEQFFTGYFPERGVREKIARAINADTDEISLTQNATFGMNFLASGLPVEPGDEIVVMNGAHPGGRCGWELRDARYGPAVRFVNVPESPDDPEQLIALYERATTPRTRVWAIPHLTSGTAVLFPVDELCRRARGRGILTVVDGAQTFGHLEIDVRRMGCDAFFTSPHKWGLAPVGTGFLYVHSELAPHVWTTLASTNWENREDPGFRLMQYGTGNLSLLIGLEKALDFHAAIGADRVEARVVGLADRLREGLAAVPGVVIRSPTHPALRSATTIWTIEGMASAELQDALWERERIRVRSVGPGIRQCCHLYTLEDDVDRTIETARRLTT